MERELKHAKRCLAKLRKQLAPQALVAAQAAYVAKLERALKCKHKH